jgi:hypothetical protein
MLRKPIEKFCLCLMGLVVLLCLPMALTSRLSQEDNRSARHLRARVLARQLGLYDAGILSDGATWQVLLVQLSDHLNQGKEAFQELAVIRYEFFAPSETGFPQSVNQFGPTWVFDGARSIQCDMTLNQLYSGGEDKSPNPKSSGNILRVNRGAEKIIPKPSEKYLPCFVVHAGEFRQLPEPTKAPQCNRAFLERAKGPSLLA